MLGRTPVNIVAVRPMTDGVIADYTTTQQLLEYIFHKVCGVKRVFKPRVLLAVPSGVTSVEKRAVKQAALAAGAGEALTIEEPMAAAIGRGPADQCARRQHGRGHRRRHDRYRRAVAGRHRPVALACASAA